MKALIISLLACIATLSVFAQTAPAQEPSVMENVYGEYLKYLQNTEGIEILKCNKDDIIKYKKSAELRLERGMLRYNPDQQCYLREVDITLFYINKDIKNEFFYIFGENSEYIDSLTFDKNHFALIYYKKNYKVTIDILFKDGKTYIQATTTNLCAAPKAILRGRDFIFRDCEDDVKTAE